MDLLKLSSSKPHNFIVNNDRKAGTTGTRRKSTGNTATVSKSLFFFLLSSNLKVLSPIKPKDEGRLMKRKEQNRAAQRAFRERKEKHVKDVRISLQYFPSLFPAY